MYVGGDVSRLFDKGARDITRRTALKLTDEGGRSIHEIATINTPVESGRLRSSWRQEPAHESFEDSGDPGFESAVETNVEYAPYVEHGTGLWGPKHAPYVIKPKRPGGMLRFVVDGKVVFARSVLHPGSPGNHMMAIALNVTEGRAGDGTLFVSTLEEWARELEGRGSGG